MVDLVAFSMAFAMNFEHSYFLDEAYQFAIIDRISLGLRSQ